VAHPLIPWVRIYFITETYRISLRVAMPSNSFLYLLPKAASAPMCLRPLLGKRYLPVILFPPPPLLRCSPTVSMRVFQPFLTFFCKLQFARIHAYNSCGLTSLPPWGRSSCPCSRFGLGKFCGFPSLETGRVECFPIPCPRW